MGGEGGLLCHAQQEENQTLTPRGRVKSSLSLLFVLLAGLCFSKQKRWETKICSRIRRGFLQTRTYLLLTDAR